jgi:hypothetical protein
MKFTNNSGLVPHLADVLKAAYLNDSYDAPQGSKRISVTQLIGPAQKLVLERLNADKLEMDVIDTVPALLGQALHHILERAGPAAPTHVPERRLEATHDGWTISGKADLYETQDKTIVDYKNSSVWTYVFGKIEWENQLNVYRWLSERNGVPVKGLAIALFCGDWRRGESLRSPDYPARVVNIPVKMWTMDEATAYVDKRLALHRAAQDGQNVPCSDEERWAKPTTWAEMKRGQKRAVAVYDKPMAALSNPGNYIVKRPGEAVRCNGGYCLAGKAGVCPQWNAEKASNEITAEVAVV